MTPIPFPEANTKFGPPPEMDESQVATIPAFAGTVEGGNCDGSAQVIVAWMPTDGERLAIATGAPVFISMLGGLAPHFLTTSFEDARRVS